MRLAAVTWRVRGLIKRCRHGPRLLDYLGCAKAEPRIGDGQGVGSARDGRDAESGIPSTARSALKAVDHRQGDLLARLRDWYCIVPLGEIPRWGTPERIGDV